MSSLSTKYRSGTKVQHQLFTANGTWDKPAKFIEGTLLLTGIGGGASGNKVASISATQIAGNSGEYAYEMYVDVSSVSSVAVTIGTGGASVTGTAPLSGNSGNPTTFGALVTLSGAVAPSTTAQGSSVGGAFGGIRRGGSSSHLSLYAQALVCAKAGNCGNQLQGIRAQLGTDDSIDLSVAAGAGGLVLDATGKKAGDVTQGSETFTGGIGYGAGGASIYATNSGAGASGAIFLTWQEYI